MVVLALAAWVSSKQSRMRVAPNIPHLIITSLAKNVHVSMWSLCSAAVVFCGARVGSFHATRELCAFRTVACSRAWLVVSGGALVCPGCRARDCTTHDGSSHTIRSRP